MLRKSMGRVMVYHKWQVIESQSVAEFLSSLSLSQNTWWKMKVYSNKLMKIKERFGAIRA